MFRLFQPQPVSMAPRAVRGLSPAFASSKKAKTMNRRSQRMATAKSARDANKHTPMIIRAADFLSSSKTSRNPIRSWPKHMAKEQQAVMPKAWSTPTVKQAPVINTGSDVSKYALTNSSGNIKTKWNSRAVRKKGNPSGAL
jgi:hypothetical protein